MMYSVTLSFARHNTLSAVMFAAVQLSVRGALCHGAVQCEVKDWSSSELAINTAHAKGWPVSQTAGAARLLLWSVGLCADVIESCEPQER